MIKEDIKSEREHFSDYLKIKFNQLLKYDEYNDSPLFQSVKPNFIQNFTKKLVNNPQKQIIIGITGESASGKTTICDTIKQTSEKLNLPVEFLSAEAKRARRASSETLIATFCFAHTRRSDTTLARSAILL